MITVLVWYLVTIGGYGSNNVTYSPALATKEDCVFLRENILKHNYMYEKNVSCVGVKILVKGKE